MYKLLSIIENIKDYFLPYKQGVYYIKEVNGLRSLNFSDKNFNEIFVFENVYNFDIYHDTVFFSTNSIDTYVMRENNPIYKLDYGIHLRGDGLNNIYGCGIQINNEQGTAIINLDDFTILKKFIPPKGWSITTEKYLISRDAREAIISLYTNDYNLIWSTGLQPKGSYKDIFGKPQEGVISNITVYKNTIIVQVGTAVVCLDLKDGKVLWEHLNIKKYRNLEVVGNIGYMNTDMGYRIINLDSGHLLSEGTRLEDFRINETLVMPTGDGMKFKYGYLWHGIANSGYNIIAAIQPETGKYVWSKVLDCGGEIGAPLFHENKMYILSDNGKLLIFEKE